MLESPVLLEYAGLPGGYEEVRMMKEYQSNNMIFDIYGLLVSVRKVDIEGKC